LDKHFNDLYLIGIARSHPIRRYNMKITKITFDIHGRTLSDFDVKGKRKKNAILCNIDTKICAIHCVNNNNSNSNNSNNNNNNNSNSNNNSNNKINDNNDNNNNDNNINNANNNNSNEEVYLVQSNVHGKIIDINRRILDDYNLILDENEGYIAIIQDMNYEWGSQKKKKQRTCVVNKLLNESQYNQYLNDSL